MVMFSCTTRLPRPAVDLSVVSWCNLDRVCCSISSTGPRRLLCAPCNIVAQSVPISTRRHGHHGG
jgi:hypothetical protein